MSGSTSRLLPRAWKLPTHSLSPPLAFAGELERGWGDSWCGGARRGGASRGGGARPAAPAGGSAAGPRPGQAREVGELAWRRAIGRLWGRRSRWPLAECVCAGMGGPQAEQKTSRAFSLPPLRLRWRPVCRPEMHCLFRILKRKEAPGPQCLPGIGVDVCIGVEGAQVSPFQAGPPSS